jgi:hypothetical protein
MKEIGLEETQIKLGNVAGQKVVTKRQLTDPMQMWHI